MNTITASVSSGKLELTRQDAPITTTSDPFVFAGVFTIQSTKMDHGDEGYTEEQFHADLKKAGKVLDKMASEALDEYAKGETRKFP